MVKIPVRDHRRVTHLRVTRDQQGKYALIAMMFFRKVEYPRKWINP
jgi:hypothetical protein